jgi:hypothetical protein
MKFYLFASDKAPDPAALAGVKKKVRAELDELKRLIDADARARAEG